MSTILLFVLAVGLSMDAFAVAVSNGMCYSNIGKKEAALTALVFGGFQGAMPVVGYFGGRLAQSAIASLDHWVALLLLGFIGGSMILESVREIRCQGAGVSPRVLSGQTLLIQGVATSIDALAVGISLGALGTNILWAAMLIGVVTFTVCLTGALLGRRFGLLLGLKAKFCGGVLLLSIGIHIFAEHTMG